MDIKYKLIDLSKHNGTVDFNRVKATGIDGVILRAGYGVSTIDEKFKEYIKKAKTAKLHIGIYWFGYAYTDAAAKKEAQFCIETLKPYLGQIDLPVFYDWEYDSYNYAVKNGVTPNKTSVSRWTKIFCDALEKAGYFVGVYGNIDYMNNYYTDEIKTQYTIWIAQWASKCTYTGDYGIWQYGAETNKIDSKYVDGITGIVDKNYCYIDYPSIIKEKGLNGYKINNQNTNADTNKSNTSQNNSTSTIKGDINKDGRVDINDLELLEHSYLYNETDQIDISVGDINGDNVINGTDVTELKKKLVDNTAQDKEENNTITVQAPKQENNNYPTLNSTVVTYSYAKNGKTFLSPHFQVKEFASTSGSKIYSDNVLISGELVNMLEKLFNKLKCTSIVINSGYRTATHDKAVGGSGSGQHVLGKAADIVCRNKDGIINSKIVCCVAADLGFGGVANISANYQAVHVDVRTGSKYYGDEIRGTRSIWNYNSKWRDFYVYFGLTKDAIKKYTT